MTTDFDDEVRNSTVLIADDTEQNVELLQAYLDELGCRVVTAADGQETLDRVAEAKPDLILLDIMMPRLSGFEVCRKLKGDPATRDIPICMVTALTEEGDIEKAVDAGTDDFLSKPINKWELLTRVRSLLRVRHLQSELERTLSYLEEVDQARGPADED
jgi:CheY-like chemotaxis protein